MLALSLQLITLGLLFTIGADYNMFIQSPSWTEAGQTDKHRRSRAHQLGVGVTVEKPTGNRMLSPNDEARADRAERKRRMREKRRWPASICDGRFRSGMKAVRKQQKDSLRFRNR
jgi:hypothetical protein